MATPSATRETASDSPKTAQAVVKATGSRDFCESGPNSSRGTWSTFAIMSRKRPQPLAHFSLTTKSVTWPDSLTRNTWLDCPWTSMTVRTVGK